MAEKRLDNRLGIVVAEIWWGSEGEEQIYVGKYGLIFGKVGCEVLVGYPGKMSSWQFERVIEVWLTYNVIVVSGVQYGDSTFL